MTDLKNRIILDDGTVICSSKAMIEMLYNNHDLSGIFCNDPKDEDEWKLAQRLCDSKIDGPTYAAESQMTGINWYDAWFTPEPYKSLDILDWCLQKCQNDEEKSRVQIEFLEFEKRNMIPVIKHLLFCVNTWRENNIFWGVGRGSSVSSFVLYLIGLNRINPIKYNLDVAEWLK